MKNKFFVYIAKCNDNSLYTGITNHIKNREHKHNIGYGSKYTKQRTPIKIIYFEIFNSLKDAGAREKQLKGWSKIKKQRLIQGKHPNPKK